ncbi:MAG: hypothetical protein L6408_06450 [Nanoarchaeota archaeon]|nr:hypothetical protein [Nanoarchaeota archaeon]
MINIIGNITENNKNMAPTQLKRVLKDFSQPKKIVSGIFNDFHKYRVSKSYEKWRLVRFLFDEILNFNIVDQPMEKVNWEISFVFRNKYPGSIAHEKFGYRIYVSDEDADDPDKIAKEIEDIIEKALRYSAPLVKEYAIDALNRGDIILENRAYELTQTYEYFRDEILKRKKKIDDLFKAKDHMDFAQNHHGLLKEISYLEHSGYVAFFSLLEHLCVLFLAFRDIPERNKIKEFAQKKWRDKFKLVFDLDQKEFKENYDYLFGISQYGRNPRVHGLLDKLHTIFHFYLPQARHRISVGLYGQDILLQWSNVELNFDKLDAFLKLLKSHSSTKRIMSYLDTGLDVGFGKHAQDLDSFSDKEFIQFLEYRVRESDDLANMDW